jgi:oligoribonuclease NrnB/cAMP/cGMP phosphodiesterase (DHH superfamily)
MLDGIVNKAREVDIQGHKVMCVNSPVLQSEIGNYLSKNKPFAAVWFENEFGEKVYSLRSSENGIDVSKIAAAYGGGGHAKAAGFRLKIGESL